MTTPYGDYPKYTYNQLRNEISFGEFDGNILNWEEYRLRLIAYVLTNHQLKSRQIIRLIKDSLYEEITEGQAYTSFFQDSPADVTNLLTFLDQQYGTGEAAYEKLLTAIKWAPNLRKNIDTQERRQEVLVIAKEVLRRANLGFYNWKQKETLLYDLAAKLPKDEMNRAIDADSWEQVLEPPCSNPALTTLVEIIKEGLPNYGYYG